jgi:cytidine deaminase
VSAARAKARPRPPARKAAARGAGPVTPQALMREAVLARATSHSPYSRFAVGAALLGASGRVYHGCNVENASFGLTCCAERTAVFKAVSEGERAFTAIAVTARAGQGAPPCGACRQVMAEFAPAMWVYWRDARGRILKKRLAALLPDMFEFKRPSGSGR